MDSVELFSDIGLDRRLLQAVADLRWSTPTDVQKHVIPLILEGKNLLVEARTGSGKTAACVLPLIQRILVNKQLCDGVQCTACVILAPTKELCAQAARVLNQLSVHCLTDVRVLDITGHKSLDVLRPLLADRPDIIVSTPARLLAHLSNGHLTLKEPPLSCLVVDEADLLYSLGYEPDVKALREHLPDSYQVVLMSATLGNEVKSLRRALLHRATWTRVELPDDPHLPPVTQLVQYVLRCEEEDKFVLLLALCKLRLVRGKSLLFCNSVDRCYRLKLFLEHFSVRSVILNSELPVASRVHVVQQFNKGLYDLLIASDETVAANPRAETVGKRKRTQDEEYGVSRGVDFHLVSNVINFDFPRTARSYIHRVGRTARADQKGTALSFVSAQESALLAQVEESLSAQFRPFEFRMEEVDGFRYRAKDAMRAVTKTVVRAARLKEIKVEMLNSRKIKSHLEDNESDLAVLRHDKELNSRQMGLGNVPEYLVPPTLRALVSGGSRKGRRRKRGGCGRGRGRGGGGGRGRKRSATDPLRTFRAGLTKHKKTDNK